MKLRIERRRRIYNENVYMYFKIYNKNCITTGAKAAHNACYKSNFKSKQI